MEPQSDFVALDTFDGPLEFRWLPVPAAEWPPGIVLSDDWNPVDTLGLQAVERSRVTRRADMPADVRAALAWE